MLTTIDSVEFIKTLHQDYIGDVNMIETGCCVCSAKS